MASKSRKHRKGRNGKGKSVRLPASPITLVTADWIGNTVTLFEESWIHIQIEHGIRDITVVQQAIQTPMRVRVSTVEYHNNAFAFETRAPDASSEHVRVLVHYQEDADINTGLASGVVKTAYPVDYKNPSKVGAVVFEAPESTLPDPDKSK